MMNEMKPIDWRLCLIADAEAAGNRSLVSIIQKAVEAGTTLVQVRGKKLSTPQFLNLALAACEFCKSRDIPLIINDRIDIALACDADGVHLGQEDIPLSFARKILGNQRLIGVSVNTVKEAHEAEAKGASYLGVGPIYDTLSKEEIGPILYLEGLRKIRKKVQIPILAVGGIQAENARDVISSGADGLAVISAIMGSEDIAEATSRLLHAIGS
jgi:thiamine-phosphate pyrophosphorylase